MDDYDTCKFLDLLSTVGLHQKMVTGPTDKKGHTLDIYLRLHDYREQITDIKINSCLPSDHATVIY